MHKATLKKLLKGIDGVKIVSGTEIEVYVEDPEDPGRADREATDKVLAKVRKAGVSWGGSRSGYGAWFLYEDYRSPGDWNDKSSPCHY